MLFHSADTGEKSFGSYIVVWKPYRERGSHNYYAHIRVLHYAKREMASIFGIIKFILLARILITFSAAEDIRVCNISIADSSNPGNVFISHYYPLYVKQHYWLLQYLITDGSIIVRLRRLPRRQ